MARTHVCACVEIVEDDGSTSLVPEIPFSEFPTGERIAAPDETGALQWYVATESPVP